MLRTSIKLAILAILATAIPALADVKIKAKQSIGGQSYENTTYIKGKRQRQESMNGMSISITQCDMRRDIQLNTATRTYLINPFDTGETAPGPVATKNSAPVTRGGKVTTTVTIKDTGERKQMFGFTARHLIITMETLPSADACQKESMKMVTDGWYIDFEPQFDCSQNHSPYRQYESKPSGCQDRYEMKTVGTAKRGYPLYEKMTMFDASGKESMSTVTEVVELSRSPLDAGLFEIPEGYKEGKDLASMYNIATMAGKDAMSDEPNSRSSSLKMPPSTATVGDRGMIGPKRPGTIRIGVPQQVRTGAVGDGIAPTDLASAVAGALKASLQTETVEVVFLTANDPTAITKEAVAKECDFVVDATISHKKGGGGFGMFNKVLAPAINATGINTGSTAGNIAASVAANTVVTAGQVAEKVKAKDELTLDLKLSRIGASPVLVKVFKAKAKSDGEDVITNVASQAAQAIIAVAKQ